jgi:hypothetical protein
VIFPIPARCSPGYKSRQRYERLALMRPAPSHVVFYVGGASAPSAAAVDAVNRFCDTLPGGFGIRVINVRTQTDRAALDGRLPASMVIERETPPSRRLTRRERAERTLEATEVPAEGAAH